MFDSLGTPAYQGEGNFVGHVFNPEKLKVQKFCLEQKYIGGPKGLIFNKSLNLN